ALAPNSYRVRRLMDDDESYNYAIPPTEHAGGAYQIELVIEKIQQPTWPLEVPEAPLADQGHGEGPSLEELNAKLGVIFTDLRGAVTMLSGEQDKASGRLTSIARQIGGARREWDATGPVAAVEAATLADYLRPDAVPAQEVITTTRFFRNRRQLKALLDQLKGRGAASPPHVLVAGTSRGCEAYSLAIEAELAGLDLSITAIDIDAENIAAASAGIYTTADFTDFDGTNLLPKEATGYFLRNGDLIQVDPGTLRNPPYFKVDDLFRHEGLYDAVICNNVLIHFSDAAAGQALARLDLLVSDGGILAVGGAPLDVLAGYLGARRTFRPIETAMEAIWEDWKGDRQSWALDPGSYVGMPPIDQTLPDWKVRFCTLFRKEGLGFGGSGQDPKELGRWLGGVEGALQGVAQGQATISSSARTIVEYLDDLLK
ncbi:MAG TPA: CheR family methyltransferase, partial [Geothrix sp.]|nr:CheR family methyltransferase [Geothrix sp.]